MKITRTITYEGTEAQLKAQLTLSLKNGVHKPGGVTIRVVSYVHPEGVDIASGGRGGWYTPAQNDAIAKGEVINHV